MAGTATPPAAPPAADPADDGDDPKVQFTEWFNEAMDGWVAARAKDPQRTKPRRDPISVLFGS